MLLSHHALLLVVAATGTWATRSALDDSHLGCFAATDSVIASLTSLGTFTFQSVGYCKSSCADSSVAALLNGDTCLCGDIAPTASDMVDSSMCSITCPGYAMMTCGGPDSLDIYIQGSLADNSTFLSSYTMTSEPTSTAVASKSSTGIITHPDATIVVTADATNSASGIPTTTATTGISSSSAVIVPSSSVSNSSATSTGPAKQTSTGAAAAVNVQVGFGLISGLMAIAMGFSS